MIESVCISPACLHLLLLLSPKKTHKTVKVDISNFNAGWHLIDFFIFFHVEDLIVVGKPDEFEELFLS